MRQTTICPALTWSRAAPRDKGPPPHYVSTADVATDLLAPRPFLWSPQVPRLNTQPLRGPPAKCWIKIRPVTTRILIVGPKKRTRPTGPPRPKAQPSQMSPPMCHPALRNEATPDH